MKVGKITKKNDGSYEIAREYFRQGMIFKDEDAYKNRKNEPCYVPELTDAIYTAEDFLMLCKGQQEFADSLFAQVDWQHPETLLDELLHNEEWFICEGCGKIFDGEDKDGHSVETCPYCGKRVE